MARYDQEKGENPKFASPSRDSSGNFDFTEPDRLLSRDYTQGSVIMPVRNITPTGTSAQQVIVTDGTDTIALDSDGSLSGKSLSVATNATAAQGNTQTVYTAPAAGAKIYGFSLHSSGLTTTNNCYLEINGVVALKHRIIGVATPQVLSDSVDLGNNYIAISSGQTVRVTSGNANSDAYGSIRYKEN